MTVEVSKLGTTGRSEEFISTIAESTSSNIPRTNSVSTSIKKPSHSANPDRVSDVLPQLEAISTSI
jgi:hypothetical protein